MSRIHIAGVAKFSIFAFWLIMLGAFLKREILPGYLIKERRGYSKILPSDLLMRDSWYGIYFKNTKLGYSHSLICLKEAERFPYYLLKQETFIFLSIFGEAQPIWLEGEAKLDKDNLLENFIFSLRLGSQRFLFRGKRENRETLRLEIETNRERFSRKIKIPEDMIVLSLFNPLQSLAGLKSGESFSITFFNPLTQEIDEAGIQVLRKEKFYLLDKEFTTFVIETDYKGFKSISWVTEEGNILKQNTPLGWQIVRETQKEALDFLKSRRGGKIDFAQIYSIRTNKELPPNIKYLKLLLKNIDFSLPQDIEQLVKVKEKRIILELNSVFIDEKDALTLPIEKEGLTEFLESTFFIPADSPQIKKEAEKILQGEKNSLRAVKKILEWMDKNIKKRPRLTLPSAKEVLRTKMGDCNEFSYLFCALARAVGIPTKIYSGLVYQGGCFYYHSWPQVYVGVWFSVDPVLNQLFADASHIKLIEGELFNQLELVKMLGEIEIEILEFR